MLGVTEFRLPDLLGLIKEVAVQGQVGSCCVCEGGRGVRHKAR